MDYLAVAKQLGQDISKLEDGETISSSITISSLDEFKSIFGEDISADNRTAFSKKHAATTSAADGTGRHAGAMARLIDYVYGDGEISSEDMALANGLFPMQAALVSGAEVNITTDEVIGPNHAPYIVNADTLQFDGGSLTLISTALTLKANTVKVANQGSKPYQIAITGEKGATGETGSAGSSYNSPAEAGRNSNAPTPGICTGAPPGLTGGSGMPGGPGSTGGEGKNGHASLPATIAIGNYDPSSSSALMLFTESGPGGDGGTGGVGGKGQDGGKGGHGCDSGCEGTNGGNGGHGGDGGPGGRGGAGGDGVHGADISVHFPAAAKTSLKTSSSTAPGGQGGSGGAGGAYGNGGAGGAGGKHRSSGSPGDHGETGEAGATGSSGDTDGTPGNFNIAYT